MKKLLIAALLAVGATSSFAGVIGTTQDVNLPISVTGEVLSGSSENLVIETETGGLDGSMMEIKFGALSKPTKSGVTSTEQRMGRFKVKRDGTATKAKLVDAGIVENESGLSAIESSKYAMMLGFDQTNYKQEIVVDNVKDGETSKNIALNYQVTGSINNDMTVYDGRIIVNATLKENSVAGHFSDTQTLYVKVAQGTQA